MLSLGQEWRQKQLTVHGIVSRQREAIVELCRRHGVRRLSVFGSATRADFDVSSSDVDFVVEFATVPGFDYFDAYFSLKEGLEVLLERPVDLVTRQSIRNPYLSERLDSTAELMYAA